MIARHLRGLRLRVVGAVLALAAGIAVGAIGTAGTAQAASSLPCDIHTSAGTPCAAARSTTRALYASCAGALYQVRRASDSATTDIGVLSTGGYANAAAQDSQQWGIAS